MGNAVSQYPRLEGRFAQVSGMTFTFDAALPGGQRVLEPTVKIGAAPLDRQKKYTMVTKDYLRNGKDGYDVIKEAICLADGEQAGILPTIVRDHFAEISSLNGFSTTRRQSSATEAVFSSLETEKVGDGPDP